MSRVRDLHDQWSRDPEYRAAYESLGPEFELARALIEAHASPPACSPHRVERGSPPEAGESEVDKGRR